MTLKGVWLQDILNAGRGLSSAQAFHKDEFVITGSIEIDQSASQSVL